MEAGIGVGTVATEVGPCRVCVCRQAVGDRGLASLEPVRNLNDIWSSPDGKKWTRVVAEAAWHDRHAWAATIHRRRMYLLGGASIDRDGLRYYQDVLSPNDGLHWRSEMVKGPWFEKRKDLAAASYRGRIFQGGGAIIDPSERGGARTLNDVWSSEYGRAWTCVANHAPWSPRCCHAFVVYRGKLWLVGGVLQGGPYATDLWSTVDGKDWQRETEHFAWPARHAEGVVVFKDKVWIVGGTSNGWGKSSLNDIWTLEVRASLFSGSVANSSVRPLVK